MDFGSSDKQAFFSLLDEYFESRPHLAGSSPSSNNANVPSLATLSRLLPPSKSSSPSSHNGNTSSIPSPPPTASSPTSPKAGEKPDMAQRLISSSIKYGTAGTKSGIGAISRNKDAMDLLGKVGAAGMVKGANDRMNTPAQQAGEEAHTVEETSSGKKAKPPAPPAKKGGVAGLVSGRSFGHVDTSSKMSAFTSMWKDPQKVQAPTVEHHQAPALSSKHSALPPPIRRDGSGSRSPAAVEVIQAEVVTETLSGGAVGQAQALYDYTGSDSGDLGVQTSQIVNIIEKTSADWWTCEDGNGTRGLVPANYLKEL
ncbi:hypothetical protein I317_04381 [Kwoniella heveanensis CBS 569]|nr:hypothetical protein I317_04381 [Kwoniella heveanensis CBS 569]